MKRLVIFSVILVALGYSLAELGARGARAVERLLTVRVASGLELIGLDWAEVRTDGLRVELHGHAPDLFARDLALESARATAALARVEDYMTASLAPPEYREPVLVEMLRDAKGLTLTGRFHGEQMRERLLSGLAAVAPELELHDLTGVNAARPGAGWGRELDVAILATARVPNAFVRVEPGAVRVEGLARDETHRQQLLEEMLSLAGPDVRLSLVLRMPLMVAVPFAFSVVKEGTGGLRLEACAARNADEAAEVEALLIRAGSGDGPAVGGGRCPAALGGPPGDWPGAIAAGLDALVTLPAGRFRLEYRMAWLEALAPAGPGDLPAALAALSAALPEGYTAHGAGPGAGVPKSIAEQEASYWMRLTRDANGVLLAGLIPAGTARQVVETHAAARFGKAAVRSALTAGPPAAPAGWERAAMAALDSLAAASGGEAELSAGTLMVSAETGSAPEAGRLHRNLAAAVPGGYRLKTRLSVDLPARAAEVPLSAGRCAVVLAETVQGTPIAFAPGSAVITQDSQAVVDRVAATLGRCPEARFEIGGHTDSQGSEGLNLRLSQARSEAVLDALLDRGVRLDRLTARGYGEEHPLVSNATEEGRARNRRIEFAAAGTGKE
ncbi:MAG TPA: OmpA family protein [Thermohalobaculum sp.]|nr:OmpA family protein [Thermohalobaculum sp.]